MNTVDSSINRTCLANEALLSELASFANNSLSRLSRAVSRLQGRGLVGQAQNPKDGRSTRATLTEAGYELLEQATPTHVASVRKLVLDPLTAAQRRQLHDITMRIQHAIRSDEGWRPPSAGHSSASSK